MSYYFSKTIKSGFDEAIEKVTTALQAKGFGVLTEIDLQATLKKKLAVDIRKYKILGACNPPFAYQAVSAEDHIGLMLPCNIIIQEREDGDIEISAIDPVASMMAVKNDALESLAGEVQERLKSMIDSLS